MRLFPNQPEAPLPVCARCRKPVDKAESSYCENTNRFVFDFYCHGAVERAVLDQEMLEDVDVRIEVGECFLSPPMRQLAAELASARARFAARVSR